jgi:hypothetical protein
MILCGRPWSFLAIRSPQPWVLLADAAIWGMISESAASPPPHASRAGRHDDLVAPSLHRGDGVAGVTCRPERCRR